MAGTLCLVVRRPDRDMPAMNAAWPLLALYFGPAAIVLYTLLGGGSHAGWRRLPWNPEPSKAGASGWARALRSAVHCAAGCAAGDLVAMATVRGGGILGGGMALETAAGAAVALVAGGVAFRAPTRAHAATLGAYLLGQAAAMYALHGVGLAAMGFEPEAFIGMQKAMAAGFVTAVLVGPARWVRRVADHPGLGR